MSRILLQTHNGYCAPQRNVAQRRWLRGTTYGGHQITTSKFAANEPNNLGLLQSKGVTIEQQVALLQQQHQTAPCSDYHFHWMSSCNSGVSEHNSDVFISCWHITDFACWPTCITSTCCLQDLHVLKESTLWLINKFTTPTHSFLQTLTNRLPCPELQLAHNQKQYLATYWSIRYLHKWTCPQVAAACSGVHSSLSQALTLAPNSISRCIIASRSSMQHWN